MKFKWPETVPILTRFDICRHTAEARSGRRCLLGWCAHAFKVRPYSDSEPIQRLAAFIDDESCDEPDRVVWEYNDNHMTTLKTIADTWNRFVASLGYTEVFEVEA